MQTKNEQTVYLFGEEGLSFFTLYWLDGSKNIIQGKSIEDAFTRNGYGAGAVPGLDFYAHGVGNNHWWDERLKEWTPYLPYEFHRCTLVETQKDVGALRKFIQLMFDKCDCAQLLVNDVNGFDFSLSMEWITEPTVGWFKKHRIMRRENIPDNAEENTKPIQIGIIDFDQFDTAADIFVRLILGLDTFESTIDSLTNNTPQ